MEVTHGGYTQVECCIRLLRMASKYGMDYFHFISGQDYPCRSNAEFDDFFNQNNGRSFMQLDPESIHKEKSRTDYLNRTLPFWFIDIPHRELKIVDFMAKALNYISSRIPWRKEIPNLRGGWNWFSWHKSVTDYVLNYSETYPNFFKRFHHTRCCDELIFATILYPYVNKLNIEVNNSLRYVNWQKRVEGRSFKSAPLILNEEEYEEIIGSGAFFCRKIHPKTSQKLLLLLEQNINKAL